MLAKKKEYNDEFEAIDYIVKPPMPQKSKKQLKPMINPIVDNQSNVELNTLESKKKTNNFYKNSDE